MHKARGAHGPEVGSSNLPPATIVCGFSGGGGVVFHHRFYGVIMGFLGEMGWAYDPEVVGYTYISLLFSRVAGIG